MPPIFPRTATGAIAAFGLFHAAPTLAQDAFTSLFVNAGGDAVQSEQQDWQADAHFTSGEAYADSARTQSGVQEVFRGTIYETQRIDRGEAVAYAVPAGEGLYALELHFAELWHRGGQSGRRVFDVEIEGQVIGRGLDTLAQTGGDADRPFVATIGGIDPAMSGAADRIEFRIIRGTDVPVLSAFALRCADGASCAAAPEPEPEPSAADAPAGIAVLDLSAPGDDTGAGSNDAAEDPVVAEDPGAAPEPMATKPMIASYGHDYSIRLDSGPWVARNLTLTFALYGQEDGLVVQITDKRTGYHERLLGLAEPGNRVNCVIFFAPADTFDAAEYQGDTCGDASGPFSLQSNTAEGQEGKPVLIGRLGGVNYTLPLDGPWTAPGATMTALPAERPDLKGVTFERDIAGLRRQIETVMGQNGAEWKRGSHDGYGVLTLSGPEPEPFVPPVDTYQIFTTEIDGTEQAWGFARRWFPPEDSRPFRDRFDEAIFGKYGPPSGEFRNPDRFASHPRIGWVWSLDEAGEKGDQARAYRCMWDFVERDTAPTRAWLSTENWRDTTAPWILAREGCGYQLVISPAVLRSDNRVRNVTFFYHDPAVAPIVRWNEARSLARALLDHAPAREAATAKLQTSQAPKPALDL